MTAQGTAEWLAERAGCITASAIADMLAKTKTGESASRAALRAKLVAERLTGKPATSFSNAAMQWGNEWEPIARAQYEVRFDRSVDQVGFVRHPELDRCGASPDGLIDSDGLVEIKCPQINTHLDYLLGSEAPKKYQPQMLWQMECTGRKWCDFVSYHPDFPEGLDLLCIRFERDQSRIDDIKAEAIRLNAEVEELISQLIKRAA